VALACLTGRSVRLIHVRRGRPKPGLAHQHMTAIRAAQQICAAKVHGVTLRSQEFSFDPGPIQAGNYTFDVGTAGSTTLVLQTVALPLAMAPGASRIRIMGGTHNPMAPCFEYIESVWSPLLAQMHLEISLELDRAGFYPVGAGVLEAKVAGIPSRDRMCGCTLEQRGELVAVEGLSAVARLPRAIGERQARRAESRLAVAGIRHSPIELVELDAASPGTVLFLICRFRHCPAAFVGLGARGKPAEQVADEAVDQLIEHVRREGALDPHAADQVVLALALAHGPSSFTTTRITSHLLTQVELVHSFLDRPIEVLGELGAPGLVRVAA
jgi:RNA 3'-terminal phosphate cyclase (ATP)